jgi:hypothetical protein
MQVNYYAKYLKYKQKYLDLKEEMMSVGGGGAPSKPKSAPSVSDPENIYTLVEAKKCLKKSQITPNTTKEALAAISLKCGPPRKKTTEKEKASYLEDMESFDAYLESLKK